MQADQSERRLKLEKNESEQQHRRNLRRPIWGQENQPAIDALFNVLQSIPPGSSVELHRKGGLHEGEHATVSAYFGERGPDLRLVGYTDSHKSIDYFRRVNDGSPVKTELEAVELLAKLIDPFLGDNAWLIVGIDENPLAKKHELAGSYRATAEDDSVIVRADGSESAEWRLAPGTGRVLSVTRTKFHKVQDKIQLGRTETVDIQGKRIGQEIVLTNLDEPVGRFAKQQIYRGKQLKISGEGMYLGTAIKQRYGGKSIEWSKILDRDQLAIKGYSIIRQFRSDVGNQKNRYQFNRTPVPSHTLK